MTERHYDAIVVGSGISGGWAAKELTEKGLKVLLLERGRNIEHIKDYKNADKEAWDYPHRDQPTQEMKEKFPVLKRDYPLNESTMGMWADEQDNPYIEEKRFDWFRGYHVGGRSLLWGRQSYRWSPMDFEANLREGVAIDWPIRYEDMAPWYDYVERFAGIAGSRQGLDVLPDGQFLPPIELNCVEEDVAKRIEKAFGGTRHLIHSRVANITQPKPEQNRVNCQYRNKCWLGCPYGAYFSTQSSTLPVAMNTGNLTLRPFSIVTQVLYDKDKKRARGVEVIDAENNQTYEYTADVIFLNASTFNSTWILMNSATDVWPDGLGSSSGELGHNVMDHHFRCGASGDVEGYEDKYYFGRRPAGFYIPRFRNVGEDSRQYLRGFGYQGSASRQRWDREIAELNIGADLKQTLSQPGGWTIGMTGFGEMLPYHENRISLDRSITDKWGLPVLAMNVEIKQNERDMRKDMVQDAVDLLEAAGVKNVQGEEDDYAPGMGIHEMGTARMGRDPATSVLNRHNQVWDAPNVFVTDGACMTSASCVNPSLTYMALTARAVDHAVSELKKGNL
ncbi:GMC oxidoreductase [Halomonas elongata]|uniref:GMC family oxidoreductase n=2 Tax=Halomonas elongata TaxID=2746 RepID=E1V543_HALED|nr:GMC family oxidoreductase [Halomonas elongata]MBW5802104.1 GMC family oxidoreductase [Halomonas elongata]RAW06566.1 GMC family oxidoreductase [Halomonas elongata]WBF18329.1 GMC family oxidoreductase [Halomonas elongata]WPU47181.1 GMC family oxidoreductase [Halomonas elongata DSM 2581]WVI71855.1 GMC family oxidoreductase [Halomonas elongata]